MGSSTAGIIYELSEDNVSDDSTPIRFMVETGTYDLGDPVASKAIQKLFLHTSRGSGLESDPDNYSAKAFREYRKNYTQAWTNPAIEVDLGRKGETQLIDCRGIGGVFRTIQFRITQQDNTRFALCGIYLDYGGG
jgi:hypothetical protein